MNARMFIAVANFYVFVMFVERLIYEEAWSTAFGDDCYKL